MLRILALAFALVSTGACRSAAGLIPADLEPLESSATIPVRYDSRITFAGALSLPVLSGFEPQPDEEGQAIDVRVQLLAMPHAVGRRLLDSPSGLGGWLVDRTRAEALVLDLVDSEVATSLQDSRLCVFLNRPGQLQLINQRAYISAFKVEKSAQVMIADPVIGVLNDGIEFQALSRSVAVGSVALDLRFVLTNVQTPIRNASANVPGALEPVTLQLPIASRQELLCDLELKPEQCAVLGGLSGADPNGCLLAFVSAEPMERVEGAGTAARSRARH
jgi:hypothetical protein